jgi:simple sugar transport system permease protein
MAKLFGIFQSVATLREAGALLSAIIVAVVFSVWTPYFLTLESITSILVVTSEMAILAMPVTLLMIAGEFDLSVGSVLGLCSVLVPWLMVTWTVPPIVSVLIALAVALLIGYLHGSLVHKLRIPSFIVTLAGLLFWRGVVFVLTQGFPVRVPPGQVWFFQIFAHRFPNGFNLSLFWFLAYAAILFLVLTHDRFGNWIYASGGNERAARKMGVPVDKVRTRLFMLTAVSAFFTGIIQVARFTSVDASRGESLELEMIAASVIGGASLSGGVGSIVGTILGCLIVGMIRNGLATAGIASYWYTAIIGLLILGAVIVNKTTGRLRTRLAT